jgi:PhnB protein
MPVPYIPEGYHSLTPTLTIKGARQAIEFYQRAFGAREIMRFEHDGNIGHCEMEIGGSRFMFADEDPMWGNTSPATVGASTGGIAMFVSDVDQTYAQAIAAGAKPGMAPADQFYGDRSASVVDPFGHRWSISTHKEDLSMEEMQRRFREFMAQMAAGAK